MLDPLELDEVSFISSSAAGFGYRGRKGDPLKYGMKTLLEFSEDADELLRRTSPDLALHRVQLSDPTSVKNRHVFGRPFHTVLINGMFAEPLTRHYIDDAQQSFRHGLMCGLTLPEQNCRIARLLYVSDSRRYFSLDQPAFGHFMVPFELVMGPLNPGCFDCFPLACPVLASFSTSFSTMLFLFRFFA